MSSSSSEWQPLYLSCIAGASTCIGAAVVFCQPMKEDKKRHVPPEMMAFSLALAGSVMVTVSALSIIPECLEDDALVDDGSFHIIPVFSAMMFWRVFFFLLGSALYFGLSWFLNVPDPEDLLHSENFEVLVGRNKDLEINHYGQSEMKPLTIHHDLRDGGRTSPTDTDRTSRMRKHTSRSVALSQQSTQQQEKKSTGRIELSTWSTGSDLKNKDQRKAWRVAMLLFVSLLVHNFPEGLAVAASALESPSLGITVTIGIMIHNIPEGIAIAVPCLAARPDQPLLAFVLASVSGLAEPAGAFVALIFLRGVENDQHAIISLENILAFVAGIMVVVALLELFPEARRNAIETKKFFWYGTICGVIVMTLTELFLP